MKHKKIIIICVIVLAIGLILSALFNSTYALFSTDDYGANPNIYTTGVLTVETASKSENIVLSLPMTDKKGKESTPYIFTVKNTGTVDYKFDVKLLSTGDSSTTFSSQYIKMQVDGGEVTTLAASNGVVMNNVVLLAGETMDISIRVWLSIDTPNSEIGKSFNSTLVTTGEAVYTTTTTLADHITGLYISNKDAELVVNNNVSYRYSSSVNLMNDRLGSMDTPEDGGNIRYYGESPNNYIYFNCSNYNDQSSITCERWRIIGVFDGKVKIVSDNSIGNYSWNNEFSNDWSTSTLKTYLNGDYYNGLSTSTKKLISNSAYYLGGWNSSAVSVDTMYLYEKGTNKCESCTYNTVWNGNIALIYASDYGYATDLSSCKTTLVNYSTSGCYDKDWLYAGVEEWLLNPYSDRGMSAFEISTSGAVTGNRGSYGGVDYIIAVRPTLYLNPGLSINSKTDGSYDSPYQILVG